MAPVSFLQHFDQNYNKLLFTFSLSSQWRQWPRYFSLEPKLLWTLSYVSFKIRSITHPQKLARVKYAVGTGEFDWLLQVIWRITKRLTNNIWSTDRFKIWETLTSLLYVYQNKLVLSTQTWGLKTLKCEPSSSRRLFDVKTDQLLSPTHSSKTSRALFLFPRKGGLFLCSVLA